ncbi:hypothetical protein BK133_05105 [Paenibacillus sp. FSL H8-0548]|uniref:hypothetical protein n=1 Tax=Paenibacillus sp. FSL H8-0548 TaxID=1920422 RepID=UPI00096E4292|nr:hypothetical protein [Paenibacillus sp. FSL H8-0548]OMF37435.1 hypothetical protein BK133_05105 [Paenibacillus sp. FSL H8-0548]
MTNLDKTESEEDKLINEKINLAKKLGIWKSFNPIEGYETKKDFKRIEEIDKRLAEITNG